jgi:hypothetical protein
VSAAWEWAKKYWEYLAATALLFLGVFLGVELKKRPVIVAGDDHEKRSVDDETAKKEQVVLQKAAEEQKELRVEQAKELQDVVEAEKERVPELEKDPDATNAFLKEVGRSVRGDDNGGPR